MRPFHAALLIVALVATRARDHGVRNGRVRLKSGGTPKVLREELHPSIQAERSHIGLESHGARDVELESKRKRDQLGNHDAVDRRPRRYPPQRQRAVFGRQRSLRLKARVDAFGIGLEHGAQASRGCVVRTLRGSPQPEGAQLHIASERRSTEHFGKSSARKTAVVVHLEKPIARMHPALHEIQVVLVACPHMGYSLVVHGDLGRFAQPGKSLRTADRGISSEGGGGHAKRRG